LNFALQTRTARPTSLGVPRCPQRLAPPAPTWSGILSASRACPEHLGVTSKASPISFHALTKCSARNSFLLTLMQIAGGCRGSAFPFSAATSNVRHLTSSFSYSSTLFCTFLYSVKTQVLFFHANPHSLAKTPGGGVGWHAHLISLRDSIIEPLSPVFATHMGLSTTGSKHATLSTCICHSYRLRTRNSSVCHSYVNSRGVAQLFPFRYTTRERRRATMGCHPEANQQGPVSGLRWSPSDSRNRSSLIGDSGPAGKDLTASFKHIYSSGSSATPTTLLTGHRSRNTGHTK
jgi:hypothetical protein